MTESDDSGSLQQHQVVPLVERAHALIEALRARAPRPVPTAVLATELGVAARTVQRDLARLRAAGIPVQVRRGPGGGQRLAVRERPDPVALSAGEISGLLAALAAVGPYRSATALAARDKLLGALLGA